MFDVKTLFFANSMLFALNGISIVIIGINLRNVPGVRQWMNHFLLLAIGSFLVFGRDTLPDLISIVVANTFIIASYLLLLDGTRRFLGLRPLASYLILTLLLLTAGWFYLFSAIIPALALRGAYHALAVMLCYGAIAAVLWPASQRPLSPHRIMASFAVGHALFYLFGMALWTFRGGNHLSIFDPDGFYWLFLVEALGMQTVVVLLLSQMIAVRFENQLRQEARRDALTGLLNRRGFAEFADHELKRRHQSQAGPVVAMIDIDNFKRLNDSHGHTVGDQVLFKLARLMETTMRREDLSARLGGEEFAVLFSNSTRDDALATLERFCQQLRSTGIRGKDGAVITITVSIGIAICTADESLEHALERADLALYQAKEQGKDRIELAR